MSTLPAMPARLGAASAAFLVEGTGLAHGRVWEAGDLIVCGSAAPANGDSVVLGAARARPRPGRVRGLGLEGDAGEPCSTSRWAPIGGRVECVLRPAARAGVVMIGAELLGGEGRVEGWVVVAGRVRGEDGELVWRDERALSAGPGVLVGAGEPASARTRAARRAGRRLVRGNQVASPATRQLSMFAA